MAQNSELLETLIHLKYGVQAVCFVRRVRNESLFKKYGRFTKIFNANRTSKIFKSLKNYSKSSPYCLCPGKPGKSTPQEHFQFKNVYLKEIWILFEKPSIFHIFLNLCSICRHMFLSEHYVFL